MALGEDPGVSGACGVSRSLQRKFTFLKTRRPNASAMKRPSAGRGRSLLVLRVCRDQSMTKTYSLTRVSAKNDRRQHRRGMTMSGPYHRPSPLVNDASITTQASNARRKRKRRFRSKSSFSTSSTAISGWRRRLANISRAIVRSRSSSGALAVGIHAARAFEKFLARDVIARGRQTGLAMEEGRRRRPRAKCMRRCLRCTQRGEEERDDGRICRQRLGVRLMLLAVLEKLVPARLVSALRVVRTATRAQFARDGDVLLDFRGEEQPRAGSRRRKRRNGPSLAHG